MAVAALFTMTSVVVPGVTHAMGDDMKLHRDAGVIVEKKTTGYRKSSFVTPVVMGDVAYFDVAGSYNFRFNCLGWKYRIQGYWSDENGAPHGDVPTDRVGDLVYLESPDKTTVVVTEGVSILTTGPLAIPPSPEQVQSIQRQGYVEDPFIGEERLLAAQQAVTWLVEKGLAEYQVLTDTPLRFTVDRIGEKTFVKTEFEARDQETQTIKRCVMWALNCWGYRFQDKRSLEAWICYVIGDAPDFTSLAARVRMILETFTFSGRIVYADLKSVIEHHGR